MLRDERPRPDSRRDGTGQVTDHTLVLMALVVQITVTGVAVPWAAQNRKPPVRQPPASARPSTPAKKVVPEMTCPTPLGTGVQTHLSFCEVMAGRDPGGGVLIKIPPHRGAATLTFDLHNLHLYSEEQVKAHRSYARYTATIGVLTMDNTLIRRAVVQSEFRTATDLVDRIGGGAGPGGVKAVAPTGVEPVSVDIPEGEEQVSLLGEKLTVENQGGTATYTQPGRPIAVISDVMLEYHPAPARPTLKGRSGRSGRSDGSGS